MPCMPTRIKSSYVDCSRASCSWRRKAARPFWSPVISRCSIRGCRYSGKFLAGSRMLVLKSRRRPLEARIGKTSELTVRLFKRSGTANQLTSAFLTMLPACSEGPDLPTEEIVADQVLDLVAVSLANTVQGEKARVSSARSLIIMKLRAAIEARLTDPTLDIKTVASAAGVSVRYANAVLAEQNTSIMRL